MAEENVTQTGTEAQAPATSETPPEGGGLGFIPEAYRGSAWAQKYDTPEKFFAGVDNMSKLVGQKEIVQVDGLKVPGEDASDEDRAAFDVELRKALAVPDDPSGYALPEAGLPEGLEIKGEVSEAYKSVAHKYGLSPEQVAGLYKDMLPALAKDAQESGQRSEAQLNEQRAATVKAFKAEFGDDNGKTEAFFGEVEAGAKYADSVHKGLIERLEKRGLADDPDVLRLAAVAGALAPREARIKTPDGPGGSGDMTQAQAREKIIELKMDGAEKHRAEIDKLLEAHFPGMPEGQSFHIRTKL